MESQIAEAWDERDDWRGVASSKERRKRQNRLHQRAHRKKTLLKKLASSQGGGANPEAPEATAGDGLRDSLASVATFGLGYLPVLLQRKAETAKSDRVLDFLRNAYVHWSLGRPIPRDLPAVTRLNALDALLRNATILRIPVQFLEADDFDSPFNSFEPSPSAGGPALPKDLCPTALQRSVTHHSWLDLFPFPGLRNNVLRGIQAGVYDEDVLCEQLCCDLLNLGADTVASVVIWGDSWDARGWEFSASFFSRSGMLLQGCPEVLETTNYWRGTRGVRRIQLPHT